MVKFRETRQRSVAKAISYRFIILVADFVAILLITHKQAVAATVVIVSNIYSTILYFGHERVWDAIKWGKVRR